MRAFLHKDLRLTGKTLLDSTLSLRYSLSPDAAWLLGRLLATDNLEGLVVSVSKARSISEAEAKRAVYDLLAQLGSFGAVIVRWGRSFSWGLRWRAWWTWLT